MTTAGAEQGPVPEPHVFVAENGVSNLVNANFFGLYRMDQLASYYQPSAETRAFTERLLSRVLQQGDVELVVSDELPSAQRSSLTDAERVKGRLMFIIGPKDLEAQLTGNTDPEDSYWLWDQGALSKALGDALIEVAEGE